MKITGEDVTRRTKLLFVVPFLVFLAAGLASAQDTVISNLDQLVAEAFSADDCLYLPCLPWQWQAYSNYGGLPWWMDCSQLSCGALFQGPTNLSAGVPAYDVVLTKNILTGETTLQPGGSTDIVARIGPPGDYQPGQLSSQDVWVWHEWLQATNCPDCWGIEGEFPPPIVTLRILLADVNDYATYQSNIEAEASSASSLATDGGFMALAEDESDGDLLDSSISCTITSPAQPFAVVSVSQDATTGASITWESCTNFIYGVFSVDVLPITNWIGRASMWGQPNTTTWTDTSATNLTARFFKVVRMDPNGDFDGDGLPNWWEVQYGLNPLDPGDATNDFDNDGYSNFDEFLMGTGVTSSNSPITVYVDSMNTNGVWDGTQAHPFRYIQDAIECSVPLSSNLAVRARPGNYYETVSNQHYDFDGNVLTNRPFVYLYAANSDWSLSTDPETHTIDSSGLPNGDTLGNPNTTLAPAVEFFDVARARINGFTIRGGKGFYGGGILAYSSSGGPIYISNCIIEKNGSASTQAGGIFIQAGNNSLIYNTVIAKNTGVLGGIFDVYGSRIWNCTIVSNVNTVTDAPAVSGYYGLSNVRNCAIWGNGFDLELADVDYSTFGSNLFVVAGAHNLTNDPILVNTAFGNYRLQTNSPVRGAGSSLPIEQRDLYGNSRPSSGSFDIGANQYTDTDGDGMQDDWETKHGLNPGSSGDATGNPDGDGFNNRDEYNHNTDPHNSDSDGDGFQDDQDPDPTAPDLVLTIEFHSFYRDAVWQYYISGVTDPSWLNQPPTQPRVIKLKNYHIGDQLSLQMKYLSGSTGDPLFFLVPLQSRGAFSVLPDANATPLLHFTDSAPPGDLTPPGGWTVTVWQATSTNGDVCKGFDDVTPFLPGLPGGRNPWLSVPNGGTNNFTVTIDPANIFSQVIFTSAVGRVAVIPPTATSPTQLVQVVSLSTNNLVLQDVLLIKGVGAQNSSTTTAAAINLDLLPPTNATIAIHKIIDASMGSPAPTNVPSATELADYLESVFGKQANVHFNVLALTTNSLTYDFNSNHVLDVLDVDDVSMSVEQAIITNFVYTPNAFNVYYVNSFTNLFGPPLDGIFYRSNVAFIRDDHPGTSVNLTAHETGHFVGLKDVQPGDPDATNRLMYISTPANPNPCRLIRDEWRKPH